MTERTPDGEPAPEDRPAPESPSAAPEGEAVTEGGYHYSVIDDEASPSGSTPEPRTARGDAPSPLLLAALAIVPAIVVGALVWLAVSMLGGGGGGGGNERARQDVGNVINAFSQGQTGAIVNRYEGALPPGYPDAIPAYPNARLLSSVVQILGDNANYLVVYDTKDQRSDVASFYGDALTTDPWQLDAGQEGGDSTVHRFSKIDDADVTGLILSAESDNDSLTTIVVSLSVTSGARAASGTPFEPGASKPVPTGFPDEVPQYPDGTIIESAFQKQAQGDTYSISMITTDSASKVVQYYRDQFGGKGWAVEDTDVSTAPIDNAEGISFTATDPQYQGAVIAGDFVRDDNYTQVEVQVVVGK